MNAITRIATAALLLALAGCGNKGPLVLPTAPAEAPAETAPTEPAPTEPAPPADADVDTDTDADATPPVEPPVEVPADGDGHR